jgi:hypothetical protein
LPSLPKLDNRVFFDPRRRHTCRRFVCGGAGIQPAEANKARPFLSHRLYNPTAVGGRADL